MRISAYSRGRPSTLISCNTSIDLNFHKTRWRGFWPRIISRNDSLRFDLFNRQADHFTDLEFLAVGFNVKSDMIRRVANLGQLSCGLLLQGPKRRNLISWAFSASQPISRGDRGMRDTEERGRAKAMRGARLRSTGVAGAWLGSTGRPTVAVKRPLPLPQ